MDGISATTHNGKVPRATTMILRGWKYITLIAFVMLVEGCDDRCTAHRAAGISRASITSKKLALPEQKVIVTEKGGLWVIEYRMPPGGMGGEVVQTINKSDCKIEKTDISS